ncbi:TPA: hypothetical protein ACSQFP_001971 [Pseudomonas aeruginosa]|uniref:hypothetical protein n=1 Tax=Pseudomonas TaxID=286 RepID=UPI0003B986F5|nr:MULTISPECIES: hypothetical protein [Pseudomonas]EIW4148319.1 hypothetical protein [Pseudomonas aeruginosa]EKU5852257.1 hypothetical protein [Pseudomonas aeruginosa]ERY00401.1 hypothetical protein Q079_00700 [Pseudomonas aeruginosa BL25]EZP20447.1 hypothetical protein V551_01334 [Pseudomonas aeruginosa BWH050]KAA5591415.1 hypothetical protein F3H14_12030 [Pseudomonas aeruginosa]
MMKILILDDETRRANEWKASISNFSKVEIDVFAPEHVSELISKFHQARFDSRGGKYIPVTDYDQYDLVIIDYDLLGLQMDRPAAWATGAELAYCIRMMSLIGYVVVVNQFGTNSFDLTMCRGISSYADTDVGSSQIASKGLWSSSGFEGFRPWHWPDLLKESARFPIVKGFVKEHLDDSVFESLGFDLSDSDLPNFVNYEVSSYIGAGQRNNVTFRDLISSGTGRIFNALEKDRPIFEVMPPDQLAAVCASILIRWLEKVVLPSQEVVSDLPHLCIQMPWVVDEFNSMGRWASLCSFEREIVPQILEPYLFQHDFLFSRPVFWAERARREILVPDGFTFEATPSIQFCEDLSRFMPEGECSSFPSDVLAFDKKRWICDQDAAAKNVNYEPQSYLLM